LGSTTAEVLVNQAEAIVRSLTNMAAADSNGYLKSDYRLNINNRRTKHYTYSYIYVRTFKGRLRSTVEKKSKKVLWKKHESHFLAGG